MKKITKLTDVQTAKMAEYRDKWIKIGLSTEPTNKERAISNVTAFYAAGKLKAPKTIIFAKSPYAGMAIASILSSKEFWSSVKNKLKNPVTTTATGSAALSNVHSAVYSAVRSAVNSAVRSAVDSAVTSAVTSAVYSAVEETKVQWISNFCGGNLWSGWQAFYEFFDKELNIEGLDIVRPTQALSQDVGWIFPYENVCILVEKPKSIHMNANGRLHHETEKSVEWNDGWGFYSLNGVTVPAWAIETPKDEIDTKMVLALTSTEQRAAIMRHIGLSKFMEALNAKEIDSYEGYKLYYLTVEGQQIGPFLAMTCPSSGRQFLEGCGDADKHENIDPTIKTCQDALKWRSMRASKNLMTKFGLKWEFHA